MTRSLLVLLALTGCQSTPALTPTTGATSPEAAAATPSADEVPVPKTPTAAQAAASPTGWVIRTPDEVMAQGNHLKNSGSVYLLQHAKNPLEWYPWGEEALNRARLEDKPIFLSIGYASCHWCHVMEHEVFEKTEVAAFMNEHFVCIKVDREERPDLDTIYMDAVQSMTGRGGWPMTVLLTPSLKPFFGGTYFPQERFMRIVTDALKRFQTSRSEVESKGDEIYAKIARTVNPNPRTKIQANALQAVVQRAVSSFDLEWGGRRGRMKFPTPIRWRFLMHSWRRWGGDEVEAGVKKTLDLMASGGIHDHLGGGFHRYTTEQTWLVPHFEKMLYDNAQLATLYTEASAAFSEPRYLEVAVKTLDFMLKEMTEPEGGFYASYDADSGGEEGTFYVWTPKQLKALTNAEDGEALAVLLGVTERGNFEHRSSILTWRSSYKEVAKKTGRRPADIEALWKRWQPVLYEARSKRVWPGLDKKLVTSWNGLAIGAMAMGYAATGQPRYLAAARKTSELIWRVHRRPEGGLYRASNGGVPRETGVLDDYAFLASGLLHLFEASGDLSALQRAKTLIDEAESRFARSGGGYYLAESNDASLILRPFDASDAVRPSGNSALLDAQLRLAALTGDQALFDRVNGTLNAYASLFSRSGLGMAGWLEVALHNLGPHYEVIIAGDPEDATTKRLAAAYETLSPPWAVRINVPASGASPGLKSAAPPTAGKLAKTGKALAYVCVRGSCKAPTSDPKVFRAQLLDGWTH
jgi:uncharacterized protein YyaL (SSP411 family)